MAVSADQNLPSEPDWGGDGINWADADCHYGDHHWDGGVCSNCGKQLRCSCGQFVTVEGIDKHLRESCPVVAREAQDEYDSLNSYLLGEAMV